MQTYGPRCESQAFVLRYLEPPEHRPQIHDDDIEPGNAGPAYAGLKTRSEEKWSERTRFNNDLICGFCPLAMPSAASRLISLDLFLSGQRNGIDLASPCNGFFTLLVGFELLDLSLLLFWSSCGFFDSIKPGVFFPLVSHSP